MAEFTPGPWRMTRTHFSRKDTGYVCIVRDVPHPTPKRPERMDEEIVHCQGHDYNEYCNLPNDADAILMTSAPDLYEALKALLGDGEYDTEYLAETPTFGTDLYVRHSEILVARAALAKAEGRDA